MIATDYSLMLEEKSNGKIKKMPRVTNQKSVNFESFHNNQVVLPKQGLII